MIVCPLRAFGVVRGCRRQRLDALALVLAQDPHRVERERRAAAFLSKPRTDSLEVRLQATDPFSIQLVGHAHRVSCLGPDGKVSCSSASGRAWPGKIAWWRMGLRRGRAC